jgi:nicotinamidase-related amidase
VSLALDRSRAALLVIDIQERLAAAMSDEHMERTLRNVAILAEGARRFGLPIVVSEQYPKGLGPTCEPLRGALEAVPGTVFLEKTDFSVCAAAAAAEPLARLRGDGRDQWIVCGMETHICVYQTVRALRERGDEIHLVCDAVVSRAKSNYRIGLGLAERYGAVLTSTETVVMELLGCARGEDFKAISKLIR